MKKVVVILSVMLFITVSASAENHYYQVNEQAVEQMFSQAEQITFDGIAELGEFSIQQEVLAEKNPWIAWLLTYTASVGVCGIHRLYLGTSTTTFIIYFCTGGGCGIVQTIDWVMLLIGALNEDVSKYINNDKFLIL